MNKNHVVHVGKFYPPHMGGIETHLQNLCRELAKSYHVDAIVANDSRRTVKEMDGSVHVQRIGKQFNISSAPVCMGTAAAIRSTNAGILHLHLPNPISTLSVLTSRFEGPIVTTYHSDVVRQKALGRAFEPVLQKILERSTSIICTSQRYLDSSVALQPHREKCVVIPYGIPFSGATNAEPEDIESLRKRYGTRLIIAVGRLVYYKGFEHLIDAMRMVDGKLLIVGDGPLRASLQKRITDQGLQNRVHLLGEIQNEYLAPYYRVADVFAFPSIARSEAFGIVQLEAMACGLPVVNTNLDSGVPFVSRHNETGLTVPPGDPQALAHALATLLNDRELRMSFGQAARRRVRSEFTVEVMGRRMAHLYSQVLSVPTPDTMPIVHRIAHTEIRGAAAAASKRAAAS